MKIRAANMDTDLGQIRECLIELQDFECQIDPRMPSGDAVADEYISEMLRKCKACEGQILVAEVDGAVCGFTTILAEVRSGDLDDGNLEFSLIDDLVVKDQYRGEGIGKELIKAAELFAIEHRARWLRISILAQNGRARDLYTSLGFSELYIEFEKELSAG